MNRTPSLRHVHVAATAAATAAIFAAAAASATPLAPGASGPVTADFLGGMVLVDTSRPFTLDFGSGITLAGTLQDRVLRMPDGTLSFGTYLRDLSGATDARITGFIRGVFHDPMEIITFDPSSLGSVVPTLASRSADGVTINVAFDGAPLNSISTGNRFVYIDTDATAFGSDRDFAITAVTSNGLFASTKLTVYMPTAVPEPQTYALMLAGLGLMGMLGRRRASKQ